MRPARIVAVVPVAVAGILLLAGGLAWLLARTDWAAGEAAARAAAALGVPVGLESLAIGYFPAPSVELRGLEVGGGEGAVRLLSLERGVLRLRWRELRAAPTTLAALRLEGLTLRPRIDAAGGDNWTRLVDRVIELAGTGPAAFSIGEFVVERGRVEYAAEPTDRRMVLTGIGLRASDMAPAQAFPLDLRLAGEAGEQVFHAVLEAMAELDPDHGRYALQAAVLRGWIGGGAFGTGGAEGEGSLGRLALDTAAGTGALEQLRFSALGVSGRADATFGALFEAPEASFEVETAPFAPRAVANALGLSLPATADPAAIGAAEVSLSGRFGPQGLELARIEGRLDDTRFSGVATLPAGTSPPRLRLSLDTLDLDRYLPPGSAEPARPGDALAALLESMGALDVDAVVEVERVSFAGAVARGLRVRLEPADAGASP